MAVLEAREYSVRRLCLLVRLGLMNVDVALSIAKSIPNDIRDGRYEAIIGIYKELKELGVIRIDLLDEAYELIQFIDNKGHRTNFLGRLAVSYFHRAGQEVKIGF